MRRGKTRVSCSRRQTAGRWAFESKLEDISDAVISAAVRNNIEIVYIEQNPALEKAGHIAALLRFRSDQNTPMKQAS